MAGSAAVGGAIQGMYNNLNKSGFNAGEEFVIAIQEGQRVGATIILGDRDVEVTLQRLTQALAKTDLKTLLQPNSELEQTMASILPSSQPLPSSDNVNFKEEMTAYVETMKAKENVRQIMSQLRRAAPELYEALVAERDAYMANGLDKLSIYPTIVAVMGIAHVDGVEAILKSRGWVSVPLSCPTRKMP
jgi:pheromone shutdown protein TraB